MKQDRQSIFKMIHLRGVKTSEIEEPQDPENNDQGPVIESLTNTDSINPFELNATDLNRLSNSLQNLSYEKLSSASNTILKIVEKDKSIGISKLCEQRIDFDGSNFKLSEIASNLTFKKEFSNLYNSWVLDKLSGEKGKVIDEKIKHLRVANLLNKIDKNSKSENEPTNLDTLLNAPVLLPKSIIRKVRLIQQKSKSNVDEVEDIHFKNQKRYKETLTDIEALEVVEEKVLKNWSNEIEKRNREKKLNVTVNSGSEGIFKKSFTWLFGRASKTVEIPAVDDNPIINSTFLSNIKQGSSNKESHFIDELNKKKSPSLKSLNKEISNIKDTLNTSAQVFYEAIDNYRNSPNYIPPTSHHPNPKLKYAIRALGWGDLIVATEKLIDYSAREIAHIENIMPGELKARKHTKSKRVETFSETEEIIESETENSLETTNRYELQKESEKAIQTDFSVSAGVNTSGRYGLTKVETSLDADFSRSVTESRRDSLNIAKEIVNKAVERTLKKTRELRRRNVITEVTDTNDHTLDNVSKDGNPNPPTAISGIYRWVEKIQEIQLRHYGKRLMLEFHIPEPAISLTSAKPKHLDGINPPVPFDLAITSINKATYLTFVKRYGAIGVQPPPEKDIEIGYAWNSTPDEGADEDAAEDTISETLVIPDGYYVYHARVVINALAIKASGFSVKCSIGGNLVPLSSIQENSSHTGSFGVYGVWPNGIPITAIAHGHFDKTMAINVWISCIRTLAGFQKWQMDTHEQIMEAYQAKLLEYQETIAQAEFDNPEINITSRPEAINRRTEQEELKKWSIKILRNDDELDFNGISLYPTNVNEVDPSKADLNTRPIQFYEEAFEWEQMSYFFYPYFWGDRETNDIRKSFTNTDARFEAFLRSGAARVIVPVTPGYEKRIIMYINSENTLSEIDKINLGAKIEDDIIPDEIKNSEYNSLWVELLTDRKSGLVQGSGTLKVIDNETKVEINTDSNWEIDSIDINREIFIRGDSYEIVSIDNVQNTFKLNEPYKGTNDNEAIYVTGSVPFGPSWTVKLPTNLVILDENKDKIKIL